MIDFVVFFTFFMITGSMLNVIMAKVLDIEIDRMKVLSAALVFRIILCYFYYYYFFDKSADATRYYWHSQNFDFTFARLFEPGTMFVKNLSSLFALLMPDLPDNYLMLYVPYGLCGHFGSLVFYRICLCFQSVSDRIKYIVPFFLPNLIFWTSNLGKDSIIYMGIMMTTYGFIRYPNILTRLMWMIPGFLIVFSVRPHVAAILLMSILFGLLMKSVRVDFKTIALSVIVGIGFFLSYERVFSYVGLEIEVESEDTALDMVGDVYEKSIQNIEQRAASLNYGSAQTGERSVSPVLAPVYLITFLGGPFIWQARKPMQFAAAIESLIYVFAIFSIIRNWSLFKRHTGVEFKYTWIFYILLGSTVMGMSFANFGLTVRQKCMIIPALMIVYLIVASEKAVDSGLTKEQMINCDSDNT